MRDSGAAPYFCLFSLPFLADMKRLFGVFTLLAWGVWHMLQLYRAPTTSSIF